ncbi:hypothetical protein [Streptomyces sp. BpilaLS-43]
MEQSLVGGCGLLGVLSLVVPAGGGDDGQERGIEEHRHESSILG